MPKIALDIIMYIFEALLFYNYANGLFSGKKSRGFRILSVALIHIVLFFVYQLGNAIVNTVLFIILYFLALWYVFNVRLNNAILHSFVLASALMISEIIVLGLCTLLFNDFNAMDTDIKAYIFVITISKIAYAAIMFFIKRLCLTKLYEAEKDSFYWVLFLLPLISIIIAILFFYAAGSFDISSSMSLLISVTFILLLFINLTVFMLYDKAYKNRVELYELKSIHFQQEIDKKYFDAIEQSQEEIKHFSHDIRNHLLQIRYIDDIEESHAYIDRLVCDIEKISYVGISKNKMLNLIISKYISICDKKGIKFTPSVKLATLCYIDDVDLSTLLNNLLDNAVDAAEKAENAEIELCVFSKNSRYDGIIIRNTCYTSPETVDNRLISSKKEKAYHGLGLNIVKKILKKYGAVYGWKYDEGKHIFETDIAKKQAMLEEMKKELV